MYMIADKNTDQYYGDVPDECDHQPDGYKCAVPCAEGTASGPDSKEVILTCEASAQSRVWTMYESCYRKFKSLFLSIFLIHTFCIYFCVFFFILTHSSSFSISVRCHALKKRLRVLTRPKSF